MGSFRYLIQQPPIHFAIILLALLLVAWLAGVLTRLVLFRIVRRIALRTAWKWDDALLQHGTFRWLGRMMPAIVIQFGVAFLLGISDRAVVVVGNIAMAYVVFCLVMAISAALSAVETTYRQSPNRAQRPIKGVIQLVKLVLFIVAALVIIASITDRKIGLLLSGLGAMSAVLILVFKDTILRFVAGIQLASNDMLRVVDWITMKSAGPTAT